MRSDTSGGAESEVSSSEEVDADYNAGEDANCDSESGAYVDVKMILDMTIWLEMRICRVHVHASESMSNSDENIKV